MKTTYCYVEIVINPFSQDMPIYYHLICPSTNKIIGIGKTLELAMMQANMKMKGLVVIKDNDDIHYRVYYTPERKMIQNKLLNYRDRESQYKLITKYISNLVPNNMNIIDTLMMHLSSVWP